MSTKNYTAGDLRQVLQTVKYPGYSRDIVSFGLVQDINIEGGAVSVKMALTTADEKVPARIEQAVKEALGRLEGIDRVDVQLAVQSPKRPMPAGQVDRQPQPLVGVTHAVAVASGKGGVGKSTVAVNLACAFEQMLRAAGRPGRVGLLDADIYGPSVPLMLGVNERPEIDGDLILPVSNYGVRLMSMGLLIDPDSPVVWRGPMVNSAIGQFVRQVAWGELDLLLIDLPPGTGDAQLSLVQTLALDGAIIVTTPQPAAVNVARRGAMMFGKVNVPLLGIVENMSWMEESTGQGRRYLFGKGGGAATARDLQCPLLGQIPIEQLLREGGDAGIPLVVGQPETAAAGVFREMARQLWLRLAGPDWPKESPTGLL